MSETLWLKKASPFFWLFTGKAWQHWAYDIMFYGALSMLDTKTLYLRYKIRSEFKEGLCQNNISQNICKTSLNLLF